MKIGRTATSDNLPNAFLALRAYSDAACFCASVGANFTAALLRASSTTLCANKGTRRDRTA